MFSLPSNVIHGVATAILLSLLGSVGVAHAELSSSAGHSSKSSHLSITFETNVGQVQPEVRYLARAHTYDFFLMSSDVLFKFHTRTASSEALRLSLLRSNPDVKPEGRIPVASYSNYLIGNDPRKWRAHIPQVAEV
jgi:hypothetical protein